MSEENKQNAQKTKDEQWSALIHVVELFRRYYSGEASRREQNSIETWELLENEKELMNDKMLEKDCDTISVWDAVSHELQFDRQPRVSIKKHFSIGKLQRRYAAAAVFFILLGGSILYYSNNDFIQEKLGMVAQANTIFQTTDAQTKSVMLPDGSRIQMNRGTKFSYATHTFNRKQREVWLEGEAFFEVAKNPDKPFIIHTGNMITTVRGTSFNVKAYPQLAENVVSVRTGKVEVSNRDQMLAVLTKNRQVTYNNTTGVAETQDIDAADISGWTEGKLVLKNASTEELRLRIKQYFNANIQIKGEALNELMFNSSFNKGTKLEEVMQTICAIYNFRYEITQSGNIIIYN